MKMIQEIKQENVREWLPTAHHPYISACCVDKNSKMAGNSASYAL